MSIEKQHIHPDLNSLSDDEVDQHLRDAGLYAGDGSPTRDIVEATSMIYSLAGKQLIDHLADLDEWGVAMRKHEGYKQMGGEWGVVITQQQTKFEAYGTTLPRAISNAVLLTTRR